MECVHITRQEGWDMRTYNWGGDFLQSWWWGEAQREDGKKIVRFGARRDGEIIAHALVVEHTARFGITYWYIPHGPCGDSRARSVLIGHIAHVAREHGATYIHCDPCKGSEDSSALPDVAGFRIVPSSHREPGRSLIIDVRPDPEEILAAMHQKTRYNIRLAIKKEVVVREASWTPRIAELFQETALRDGFSLHSEEHYAHMYASGQAHMLAAYDHSGRTLLAAHMLVLSGNTLVYAHGGSSSEHRELMAPYALHYKGMQVARSLGCAYYDLWGVDSGKWPGVTRFKKGFGGLEIHYPPAFDVILRRFRYSIYRHYKRARG